MSYNIRQYAELVYREYERAYHDLSYLNKFKFELVPFEKLTPYQKAIHIRVGEWIYKEVQEERERATLKELKQLKNMIEEDEVNNKVWREGSQYFETIIDYLEGQIKDLENVEK